MQESNHFPIEKARSVATFAHEGQRRKTSGEPYITHPEAVAKILKEYGAGEDVIAAGLLHDVLEDAPDVYPRQKMLDDFNQHIVDLVDNVTEKKLSDTGEPIPWIDRKKAYIDGLMDATDEGLLVSIADKIHNLDSVLKDYSIHGNDVWKSFKSSPLQQFWYYGTLNKLFTERLGAKNPLVKRLKHQCNQLEEILFPELGEDTSKYPSARQ